MVFPHHDVSFAWAFRENWQNNAKDLQEDIALAHRRLANFFPVNALTRESVEAADNGRFHDK